MKPDQELQVVAKRLKDRGFRWTNQRALIVRTSLIYGGAVPSKHELAARDPSLTFFTNDIRSPVQVTLVDRDDVPDEKSCASTSRTFFPCLTASPRMPAPVIPPPMTTRSHF